MFHSEVVEDVCVITPNFAKLTECLIVLKPNLRHWVFIYKFLLPDDSSLSDVPLSPCLTSNFFVFCFEQMQLSPVRQAELHSDLRIQEKDELLWKKLKVEGLDENGEKEAQLRRNFNGETVNMLQLRDQNLF